MELKLICHGMMLFWYRQDSRPGADDYGYTILIPQRFHHGKAAHDLIFRVGPGDSPGIQSLKYPDGVNDPIQTRHFELVLPGYHRPLPKGPKDKRENLSFYADGVNTALYNPDGIAFKLRIPYPMDERPVRVADYKNGSHPYLDGATVNAFQVTPHRTIGTRVLTFTIPNSSKSIDLFNLDTHETEAIAVEADTRLHLYCQPPDLPLQDEEHIHMLNAMLTLGPATAPTPFNLVMNKQRETDIDPADFSPPQGLGFKDLLHLWEIKKLYPNGFDVPPKGKRFADPAECGQGGGCFQDPPPCTPDVDC